MERRMLITDALRNSRGRGPEGAMRALVEAKAIRSRTGLQREIMEARRGGDWPLACALILDDFLIRVRELQRAREGYVLERQRALSCGDTGLVVKLEVEWDARLGVSGGEDGIRAETADAVGDALFEMYRRGNMSPRQWSKSADRIMEMLTGGLTEILFESGKGKVEFVRLTPDELERLGAVWMEGVEGASARVGAEERVSGSLDQTSRAEVGKESGGLVH
ncbi:MAG: hypothetical protein AB1657_01395 [Candidatus Micrarchaeota archaeon]